MLVGDTFMPETHLRQSEITYGACGPFNQIQNFKEPEFSRYIDQNQLDKACFQHDVTDGDFENLTRRTASDKVLHYKSFNIAKNPKYDEYQGSFTSIFHKQKTKNQHKNYTGQLLEIFRAIPFGAILWVLI